MGKKTCVMCGGSGADACPDCVRRPGLHARATPIPAVRHEAVAHEVVASLNALPVGAVRGKARQATEIAELLDEMVRVAGGYVGSNMLHLERNEDNQVIAARVTVPGAHFLVMRTVSGFAWHQLVIRD